MPIPRHSNYLLLRNALTLTEALAVKYRRTLWHLLSIDWK
jgi:hypothetical protein